MFHGLEPHLILERPWTRLWKVLRDASVATINDNCLSLAKGAAFSGLFSFFPVLTTVAALLVEAQASAVSHAIATFLYQVVPPGADDIVLELFVVHGQRPKAILIVAVLLAAWAASGGIVSLMEGFRVIYHIPSGRPFVKDRAVAVMLVFACALPLWIASVLIVFGERILRGAIYYVGLLPIGADLTGPLLVLAEVLRYGVAFGAFVLAAALIYHFAPNRKQTFTGVLPGAMVSTVLWMISTVLFAWYIKHVSNYNVLYGSVGAGLALLMWMYILSVVMLFGCEVNVARENIDAPH